jgi:hypothetical protein
MSTPIEQLSTDYLDLPKNKAQLVRALDIHVERESRRQTPRVVMWHLFTMYLNGVREFPTLNFRTGEIKYNYINDWGRLVYQHNKMISTISKTIDQLVEMDVSPKVRSGGAGLQNYKEAAVGQTILNALVNPAKLKDAEEQALFQLHVFGFSAISFNLEMHPSLDVPNIDPEVVHPSELLF